MTLCVPMCSYVDALMNPCYIPMCLCVPLCASVLCCVGVAHETKTGTVRGENEVLKNGKPLECTRCEGRNEATGGRRGQLRQQGNGAKRRKENLHKQIRCDSAIMKLHTR